MLRGDRARVDDPGIVCMSWGLSYTHYTHYSVSPYRARLMCTAEHVQEKEPGRTHPHTIAFLFCLKLRALAGRTSPRRTPVETFQRMPPDRMEVLFPLLDTTLESGMGAVPHFLSGTFYCSEALSLLLSELCICSRHVLSGRRTGLVRFPRVLLSLLPPKALCFPYIPP